MVEQEGRGPRFSRLLFQTSASKLNQLQMHLPLIELQICGLNQTAVLPLGLLQTQVPGISHGHGYHQRLDVVKIYPQVPFKVLSLFQQRGPLNHFLQVFQ